MNILLFFIIKEISRCAHAYGISRSLFKVSRNQVLSRSLHTYNNFYKNKKLKNLFKIPLYTRLHSSSISLLSFSLVPEVLFYIKTD